MKRGSPAALVVDADPDTLVLLREWLSAAGWTVVDAANELPMRVDLVLIDLAYPRRGDAMPLQRIASTHAGVPVLALSATFHASVEPWGEVARALGVAGVLPKPIRRDALVAAVRHLSRQPS
jgi:CheY-like chemotaxis protein